MAVETLYERRAAPSEPPGDRSGMENGTGASLAPPGAGASLAVTFRHVGSVCILSLHGVLTTETLGVFESQIDRLGRTTCRRVVVDVARLTAIDDTAVRVLIGLLHYVRARGGHLRVTGAGEGVSRILASTPLPGG